MDFILPIWNIILFFRKSAEILRILFVLLCMYTLIKISEKKGWKNMMYIFSLILSIWHSILFWDKEPGLSVVLFVVPFVYCLIKLLENNGKIKNKKAKLLAIPIILLSCTYFIFNNVTFRLLNALVIPTLIVIMTIQLLNDEFILDIKKILLTFLRPITYFIDVVKNSTNALRGKRDSNKIGEQKDRRRIVKAIILTIPILFVVFILLVTADTGFAEVFIDVLIKVFDIIDEIQDKDILLRVIVTIFTFLYIGGFFSNALSESNEDARVKEKPRKDNLTIKMMLTALNVLYVIFCIIQIKSLIHLLSISSENINYSYQARQGFFQLMLVSAINLNMILISKKDKYIQQNSKYIKIMDFIMLGLTMVILVSSFIRLNLYQQGYGLTMRRMLAYWTLITEAILIIPTVMYVSDTRIKLTKIYFIIILTMYVILNFINVDRVIASKNIDRYLKKDEIEESDIYYLTKLSTDAIPEWPRLLDKEAIGITKNEKQIMKYFETQEEKLSQKTTIPEFNISKNIARKVIEENYDDEYKKYEPYQVTF